MGKINRYTGTLLTCAVELVIGILLLIDPVSFTTGIIIVLGLALMVAGLVSVVKYIRADPETASQEGGLAKGLIFLLLGFFCVFRSDWFILTFPLLTVLYGVLALVCGICKVQWAADMLRSKQKYWYVGAIAAFLTIVFALLILANPFAATATLWTFVGVTMIVEAAADCAAFFLGRK